MSRGLVFLVYTMENNTPLIGGAFLTIEQANQCIESIRENDELTHGDPVQYCISSVRLYIQIQMMFIRREYHQTNTIVV